jgi:hypothetical protein
MVRRCILKTDVFNTISEKQKLNSAFLERFGIF